MKETPIQPGTYVLAVSGGVDSMVLLDKLAAKADLKLIVAHFDHGIRPDSVEDRRLVQRRARQLDLPFAYGNGHLGAGVSEAAARTARYQFLDAVRQVAGAQAIVTAHHQDDVLETAIINLLRGTNRRGLTALKSTAARVRPLLSVPKADITAYATARNLEWHEDSTNEDEAYLRNYIRHQVVPKMSPTQRQEFLRLIEVAAGINEELDTLLDAKLKLVQSSRGIHRQLFVDLDHAAARELFAFWLRREGIRDYDRPMLERLVVAAKTGRPGASFDVTKGLQLKLTKDNLALYSHKR